MTAVVAVQGSTWVVMGWDSHVEEGDKAYVLPSDAGKGFRVGDYLIGVAGEFRAITALSYSFVPPAPGKYRATSLDKFMAAEFVPELRSCFEAHGVGKSRKSGAPLLVAVNGTVYEIGDDFSIIRDSGGLYGIGTGGGYALAALHSMKPEGRLTITAARDRVARALDTAATLAAGVRGPMYVDSLSWSE